jgi:membrane fusion protein
MTSPFRPEAISSASTPRYGTIILYRSPGAALITGFFVAAAVAIIVFLAVFSFHRKIAVYGVILPDTGLIRITTTQPGIIKALHVHEGQAVLAGQTLFVLESGRASVLRGETEKEVSQLILSRRVSLSNDRRDARHQDEMRLYETARRLDALALDAKRIDSQVELQERRVALAEAAISRYSDLEAQHFVSAAQVQDKQSELIDQTQRLVDVKGSRAANARDLALAHTESQQQRIQMTRDAESLSREIAAMDEELAETEARRELLIRAPQDGVVGSVTAGAGQSVSSSQVLASLVPRGALMQAELYAPSRAVGFVRPGMQVMLRYQSFPYAKFGQHRGDVREVANSPMRPDEMTLPGATVPSGSVAEPLYRIRVALDEQTVQAYGRREPLRPGMIIEASLLLESRHLYEWILEPLYSIKGRL